MPVPQVFSQTTHSTIDLPRTSSRIAETAREPIAWTLSREFWQQKNFRAHRLRASSALAKTGFLRESRAADSRAEIGVARDASPLMVNDPCTRASA